MLFRSGENEKVLNVSIDVDKEGVLSFLEKKLIKNDKSFVVDSVREAIEDAYKRLIEPSIEREIRSELTEVGEEAAIDNFGKNLEALLLTPPMKEQIVLAFDPGYVNGCKLAVVDKNGKYLVTKSGNFGYVNTLVEIVDYFKKQAKNENV